MRYQVWFISSALVSLLMGIGVGLSFMTPMGGNLVLLPTHVHFNLIGWATLALYGLIHQAFPEMRDSRLAPLQFWLAVAGGFLLPIGFALARDNPLHKLIVGLGAAGGATAASLFTVMFGMKVVLARRGTGPAP